MGSLVAHLYLLQFPSSWDIFVVIINPRRACAARVTVLGSVCVSVTQHLTSRIFIRATNDTTYLTGNEGQKICVVFSENVRCKVMTTFAYFGRVRRFYNALPR